MLWRLRRALTAHAIRTGKLSKLFLRFGKPSADEYTEWFRRHGGLYSMGEGCRINRATHITDPAYTRIGNNVVLGPCTLIGHNGGHSVLQVKHGVLLDDVGKIDIKDNSFVGWGALILPGVTIGPDSIVAAGSIVNRDVPPGMLVAGTPAKPIMTTEAYFLKLKEKTESRPWYPTLSKRVDYKDRSLEAELDRQRIAHFFPEDSSGNA